MNQLDSNDGCLSNIRLNRIVEDDEALDSQSASHLDTCVKCQERLTKLAHSTTLEPYNRVVDSPRFRASYYGIDGVHEESDEFNASFGRYRIESRIGSGGMGAVYKARDEDLGRSVALKVLKHVDNATALARFEREANSVSQLSHPHVVPVYTTGKSNDGRPFLVMPFITGSSLQEQLQRESMSALEAARLVCEIASGLGAAHESGLIHRDVKPANILLDAVDDMAKLVDFGLVRGDSDGTLTNSDVICGTPEYMSPEQASCFDLVDARSDIYSLGITLYECLTGSVPFRGHPLDVLAQHRELEPVPPSRLTKSVPRDLETICLKAIEKDPRRRYASAVLFVQDLENFLAGRPVIARPVGPVQMAYRWAVRNRAVATAASMFCLALLAGTITSSVLWLRSEKNASLAKERNRSLLSTQKVLRENQNLLRNSLRSSFRDTFRDRAEFSQMSVSVRNTTLISLWQSYQLLFETGKDDSELLREIIAELAEASQFGLEHFMERRASELTELQQHVVDRLLVLQEPPVPTDLLLASRAYCQSAAAQQALNKIVPNDELAALAQQSYREARRFGERSIASFQPDDQNLVEQATILSFQSQVGIVILDETLDSADKLTQLNSLAAELEIADKSDVAKTDWLKLQQRLSLESARLAAPLKAIEYRIVRRRQLRALAELNSEHDARLYRDGAVNNVMIGRLYAQAGDDTNARQFILDALPQLKSLTELYALNSIYRADYLETLLLAANLDWKMDDRAAALDLLDTAVHQADVLAQTNPQDWRLLHRCSEIYGVMGTRCQDAGRLENAARAFVRGAELARKAAATNFKDDRMASNSVAVDLISKAINAFESAGLTDDAASSRSRLEELKTL